MWTRRVPLRRQLVVALGGLLVATVAATLAAHEHQSGTAAAGAGGEGESSCAGPRWPVKTLADPAAASVNLTRVEDSTVAGLRGLVVPRVGPDSARVQGTETKLVRVTADLVTARTSPDGDLAVVVSVPGIPGQTMTVEFPSPSCLGPKTSPSALAGAVAARRAVESACGTFGATKTPLSGSTTVTGVQFVDTPHKLRNGVNARQAAPNEVELHPVLAIGALTCHRDQRAPGRSSGALVLPREVGR